MFHPQAQALEERLLLTLSLDGEYAFTSYAGVGFSLNPVAQIVGTYNGQADDVASDYHAQINWGDSGSWDSNVSLVPGGTAGNDGFVLVKGSHIYSQKGTFDVTTSVTGPDGQTVSGETTSVTVSPMPDASSQPITVPTAYQGAEPLAYEGLSLDGEYAFTSYAGVGFSLNPVAQIVGTYNGQADDVASDYHAQINWGDSGSWDSNVSLVPGGTAGNDGFVLVKGSHVYKQQGTYDVVVYVTGPDGQTISGETTSVTVSPMPDASSQPITVPTAYQGAEPLAYEGLSLDGEYAFTSYAGVGFSLNPVAQIVGTYNGQADDVASDYHAQINWGDSGSWDSNVSLVPGGTAGNDGFVLVKGSHIYAKQGTYDVVVYVTGPDGQTISGETTSVTVSPMPDASSQPITVPTAYQGAEPLAYEGLSLDGEYAFTSYAGVGFSLNLVAQIVGTYNGQADDVASDYHAQINWGDSGSWDSNVSLVPGGTAGNDGFVLVKGSHVYKQQGTYDVVVYVTGPDGQTISGETTSVTVAPDSETATLTAPAVTGLNASQQVPYILRVVYQSEDGMISGASVPGSSLQVVAPDGESVTASPYLTFLSGQTDGKGDASTITVYYEATPVNGSWDQAPQGTYTVDLVGSAVTSVSGVPVAQGSLGTFQVSVTVDVVADVPPLDTSVPTGGTFPLQANAQYNTGNIDSTLNGPATILLNGQPDGTANFQGGNLSAEVNAPTQPGTYSVQVQKGKYLTGGVSVYVQAPAPSGSTASNSPNPNGAELSDPKSTLYPLYQRLLNETYGAQLPSMLAKQGAVIQPLGTKFGLTAGTPYANFDNYQITISAAMLAEYAAANPGFTLPGFLASWPSNMNAVPQGTGQQRFLGVNSFQVPTSTPLVGSIVKIAIQPINFTAAGLDVHTALANVGVILTAQQPTYFRFSTVTLNTPLTPYSSAFSDYHPVSGSREFGYTLNADGSVTFYTRGLDSPLNVASQVIGTARQQEGWTGFMQGIGERFGYSAEVSGAMVNSFSGSLSTNPTTHIPLNFNGSAPNPAVVGQSPTSIEPAVPFPSTAPPASLAMYYRIVYDSTGGAGYSGHDIAGVTNAQGQFSVTLPPNQLYTLYVYNPSTKLFGEVTALSGLDTGEPLPTVYADEPAGPVTDPNGIPDLGEFVITGNIPPPAQAGAGDFDGDGKSDIAIYDQTAATFYISYSGGGSRVQALGNPLDKNIPVTGDYDGDGKTDLAIYDQTLAEFFILDSNGGSLALPFGNPKDVKIPIAGDFDGDGKTDIAIYDQTLAEFFILKSGGGSIVMPFGNPKDVNIPEAGDFDGDGKTDIAIYDQTAATFYILDSGGGSRVQALGNPRDVIVPIAADYDGDGKTDLAIYDQTAGVLFALETGGGTIAMSFGNPADVNIPLAGDFDGDGRTDVGIYDQALGEFFVAESSGGSIVLPFGNPKHKNLVI